MLDGFGQDLRFAVRTLRASPGFTAVAVLSLALGIGANTAIFSLIDAVMLRFLPVSHPEELQQVTLETSPTFTNPIWEQVRDRQDVFSGVFAFGGSRFNLNAGGEARYVQSIWASGGFFSTLGVHAVLGRTFTSTDDRRGCPGTAVLSYDFWQKEYGGSADVLQRGISLDGHPFQILGVVQPGFYGVDVGRAIDVVTPICTEAIVRGANTQLDQRSSWWLQVVGRPKPGVSVARAAARLKVLSAGIFDATVPQKWRANDQAQYRKHTLQALPAANGMSNLRKQYRPALLTLMVVVGVVLLIACANVANLLLARAAARQREIAIRLALGMGHARLIRQLLTESVLLALGGAALGMLFAQWGSRLLVRFLSTPNNRVFLDLALNPQVLAFTIAVALATGILFGLAPAWRATRVQPQAAMKENARGLIEGGSRLGLGKVLVMVQVALSLVLLVGAGLLLGTFRNLETMNPGFEPSHVLVAHLDLRNGHYPKERIPFIVADMLEKLRSPGVRSASSSDNTPVSGSSWDDTIQVDGFAGKSEADSLVYFYRVSPRFFETLGIPLLGGRDFDQRDTTASGKVAIVNQAVVRKFFHGANPVGKYYRATYPTLGPPVEIVGVVGDAKYRSLREEILPTAYVAASQEKDGFPPATFEIRTAASAADLVPGVKAAIEQVNRDITLDFRTLSDQVAASLTRERLLATLSGFFGALALLLATVGLYGVMSYNVARRRGEIGIRMALGAQQARVMRLVLGEAALLAGVGLAAGLGAAWATTHLLSTFVYGMTSRDPWTFAAAGALLGGVALLAGYLPARRAARMDPMGALREE